MDVHSLHGGMDNRKVSVVLKRRVRDCKFYILVLHSQVQRWREGGQEEDEEQNNMKCIQ